MCSQRSEQANRYQRIRIIEFMWENPDMVSKKFSNSFTFDIFNKKWAELKEELDKLGPIKSVKVWQKYWNDRRSKVKRKKGDKVRSIGQTGGSEDDTLDLTKEEEKIVSLIGGNVVVQGDMTVQELGFGATPIILEDTDYEVVNVSVCNTTTIFDDDNYNSEQITEKEPVQGKMPPISFEIPAESVAAGKDSGKRSYSTTPNLNRKKSTNFRGQQQSTCKGAQEKMVELQEQEIELRHQEIKIKWQELQLRQEEIQIKKKKADNIASISDTLKIIAQHLK